MPSIYKDRYAEIYTFRKVRLQFTSRLFGGTPLRPDVIEAWIRSRAGINQQQELAAVVKRTITELDPELAEQARGLSAYELMKLASEKLASSQSSVGFKRDREGLFIESRQVKAGLREVTNMLFAGEKWGKTGKGPKNWLAERVFVGPERIHLGVDEPTNLELFVGHVSGPQGPRSTLTYYQFVSRPKIEFIVASLQDDVLVRNWDHLWMSLENVGLGALRSQDAGRFEVELNELTDPVPLADLTPAWQNEQEAAAEREEAAVEAATLAGIRQAASDAGGRNGRSPTPAKPVPSRS